MNETQLPPLENPPTPKTSALAIWSLVLGICGVVFLLFCLGPIFAIPAVICGHMAMSRIKHSPLALTGNGMAIAGLVTGYLSVALSILLIPMMMAIAIPNFVKARSTAQMNGCINNLREIDHATQQWALEHQKKSGDVPTWEDLNPYLKRSPLVCPASGVYTLHTVGEPPTCSIPEHKLP